jgi:hypothetical protein
MSLTIDVPTRPKGDRLVVNASAGSGEITLAICKAEGRGWAASLSLNGKSLRELCQALDHAAEYAGLKYPDVTDLNRRIDQAIADLDRGEGLSPDKSRRRLRAKPTKRNGRK